MEEYLELYCTRHDDEPLPVEYPYEIEVQSYQNDFESNWSKVRSSRTNGSTAIISFYAYENASYYLRVRSELSRQFSNEYHYRWRILKNGRPCAELDLGEEVDWLQEGF